MSCTPSGKRYSFHPPSYTLHPLPISSTPSFLLALLPEDFTLPFCSQRDTSIDAYSESHFPTPVPLVDPIIRDIQSPSRVNCPPIVVQLKDPSYFPSQPQQPLLTAALIGLEPIIKDSLTKGYIRPTHSSCNTPILVVIKPSGTYRLVQDLRLINSTVKPIHPLVPNPYTLLSQIPAVTTHFSVIDLKDAFFSTPLAKESQDIFAFTWTDPKTRHSQQFTWTVLPPGGSGIALIFLARYQTLPFHLFHLYSSPICR
uniref:uncharacterized protein LOC120883760 n=1 Tax=Ictidomys tridecemlineatus TaxID=43179 RepID=UPI001A9E94BF|nr:uncharacterized protein LOC120883760 [Ictidomys tridecemlineatus]